jgi:hypothetical protein
MAQSVARRTAVHADGVCGGGDEVGVRDRQRPNEPLAANGKVLRLLT